MMIVETAEDIRNVLNRVSKVMNLCKPSVTDKESLRDECETIIKDICGMHGRLVESAGHVETDIFPKTIPYTNLLHLQAMNRIAQQEAESQLENYKT